MSSDKLSCFTIGHSNHTLGEFLSLIHQHHINCLVDVRTAPFSKYVPHFNKDSLEKELKHHKILYVYMGDKLGGKVTDMRLLDKDGYPDYELVAREESFIHGLDVLVKNIRKGLTIALMCAEKHPTNCHRFHLVSKNLAKRDVDIRHILEDGTILSQKDAEKSLIEEKPDKLHGQKLLFEE